MSEQASCGDCGTIYSTLHFHWGNYGGGPIWFCDMCKAKREVRSRSRRSHQRSLTHVKLPEHLVPGVEPVHVRSWSRRILVGVIVSLCVVAVAMRGEGRPQSNGSTDGRYHTCGFVTDSGVTEHLPEYHARCGTFGK
jgi:hypothetical protein